MAQQPAASFFSSVSFRERDRVRPSPPEGSPRSPSTIIRRAKAAQNRRTTKLAPNFAPLATKVTRFRTRTRRPTPRRDLRGWRPLQREPDEPQTTERQTRQRGLDPAWAATAATKNRPARWRLRDKRDLRRAGSAHQAR